MTPIPLRTRALELHEQGWTRAEIADQLCRSETSVKRYLKKQADEPTEESR